MVIIYKISIKNRITEKLREGSGGNKRKIRIQEK